MNNLYALLRTQRRNQLKESVKRWRKIRKIIYGYGIAVISIIYGDLHFSQIW